MMKSIAGPEDFPVTSDPAPCPARFEDCRCGVRHKEGLRRAHICEVPSCGAMWTTGRIIIRLPGKNSLRRLRAVA